MASPRLVRNSSSHSHWPVLSQITGSPTQRTSRRPRPRTDDIVIFALSTVGLASPLVTIFGPSKRTTRCVMTLPGISGESNTVTRPSSSLRSAAATGAASTTSPMLILGSIEPLSMTYGRQPKSIGTSVTSRQPMMNHSQLRPIRPAASRVRAYLRVGGVGRASAACSSVVGTAVTGSPSLARAGPVGVRLTAAGPDPGWCAGPGPAGSSEAVHWKDCRSYCSSHVNPAVTVLPWSRLSPALVPVVAKVYAIR